MSRTRFLRRIRLASCLALALSGVAANDAQAQIRLRPAQDSLRTQLDDSSPSESSRREYHTSRSVPPSLQTPAVQPQSLPSQSLHTQSLQPQKLEESVHSASSDRDREYAELQREANALEQQLSFVRRIVKFASPSIVHIEATKKADPGKGFASSRIEEAGAGVIINLRGKHYVLTNRHVIHPADLSSIRLELNDGRHLRPVDVWTDPSTDLELNDGRHLRPVDVWTDPSTDVAVIRVDEPGLVSAKVGNSDAMDIGDFVLAVGSPFGLSHSVTYGILSAKGRRNLELGSKEIEIQDFFQTDAAINPGNSGGPLLNLRGEVVGVNTAIASNSGGNEGIGFSIPINMAVLVADQLVSHGRLLRSYLGVQLENTFDVLTAHRLGLQSTSGALVKSIIPGSPAERAGVRVGDVIVEFHGRRIESDGHLVKTVGLTPVGTQVGILVYRDGSPMRLRTQLDASPDQ